MTRHLYLTFKGVPMLYACKLRARSSYTRICIAGQRGSNHYIISHGCSFHAVVVDQSIYFWCCENNNGKKRPRIPNSFTHLRRHFGGCDQCSSCSTYFFVFCRFIHTRALDATKHLFFPNNGYPRVRYVSWYNPISVHIRADCGCTLYWAFIVPTNFLSL